MMRLFGVRIPKEEQDKEFSKVDLDYLVQSSIDNAKNEDEIEDEVKIFHNALDFSDTKVRDCMVPRTEIEAVNIEDCTMEQLQNRFVESGHSKLVVYREDIDHIIGYVHSSDLGTSGLVSLEDIVEEIFGDIEDEHDNTKYVARELGEGEYMLSARLEIEKVNELFGINLPESDEYMTVGGLILHEYQSFPKLNEVVKIGHFEFKIVKNTMTKIELVRLKVTS